MRIIINRIVNALVLTILLKLACLPALADQHQDPPMEGRGGPSRTMGSGTR
ncbi:MAG: hypothetical protein AAFY26_06060 [Cyanobacteria bacterium J06638_22]